MLPIAILLLPKENLLSPTPRGTFNTPEIWSPVHQRLIWHLFWSMLGTVSSSKHADTALLQTYLGLNMLQSASIKWTRWDMRKMPTSKSSNNSLTLPVASENVTDITFIPISALKGDNVVDRSDNMPWYKGPPLLYHLENVYVGSDSNHVDARFPVQWVIRPHSDEHHDFRGFAGRVAGGVFKTGDEVTVLPSGFTSKIKQIFLAQDEVDQAFHPQSVTILLEDEIDVSRGDMLVKPNNQPNSSQDLDARICWFSASKS